MSSLAPPPLDRVSRPMFSFLTAAVWTIAALLVFQVAMVATESLRPGASFDLVNFGACLALAYSAVTLVLLRLFAPHASLREVLGARATSPLAIALAAVGAGALAPGADLVEDWMSKAYPTPEEDKEALARMFDTSSLGKLAVVAFVLVVVLPLFEEAFFRGVLFGGLRARRGVGAAIVVTAVNFALLHRDPPAFFLMLALGLLLGWVRASTASVVTPIVARAAYFAVPLVPLVVHRGQDEASFTPRAAIAGVAVAAVALAAFAWLTARSPRLQAAREADE
jgi:membrane protease YdiL (CAAX protease family)